MIFFAWLRLNSLVIHPLTLSNVLRAKNCNFDAEPDTSETKVEINYLWPLTFLFFNWLPLVWDVGTLEHHLTTVFAFYSTQYNISVPTKSQHFQKITRFGHPKYFFFGNSWKYLDGFRNYNWSQLMKMYSTVIQIESWCMIIIFVFSTRIILKFVLWYFHCRTVYTYLTMFYDWFVLLGCLVLILEVLAVAYYTNQSITTAAQRKEKKGNKPRKYDSI